MTVFVVAHTKGGTGKTTIGLQTALTLNARGSHVWFVDGDDQATGMRSMRMREEISKREPIAASGYPDYADMRAQVRKQRGTYDHTVIDVGGGDNKTLRAALLVADILVAPLNVGVFELWALEDLEHIVGEINATREAPIVCRSLLNCADPKETPDNRDCRAYALESELFGHVFKTEIVRRKPVARASYKGLAMAEYRPTHEGAHEINAYIDELLKVKA